MLASRHRMIFCLFYECGSSEFIYSKTTMGIEYIDCSMIGTLNQRKI